MLDETIEQNQNLDPNTPPSNPEPNSNQAPPTNTQTEYQILRDQAFRESERVRMQQAQELETLRNAQRNQQAPNNDEANRNFFDRPADHISQLVKQQVEQTIAPIATEFRQFTRMQTYQSLKNSYRSIPNFAALESIVDQIMTTVEPTAQNMNAAITMAVGRLTLEGNYQHQQPPQNNQQPPQNRQLPPNLPPSNPPAPNNNRPNSQIQLTELQKRIARENRMSDEEYIGYLLADSKEVITMEKK